MVKKIYLGSSDFTEIVVNDGLLADKSLYIKDVIDSPDKVMLITVKCGLKMGHFFTYFTSFLRSRGLKMDH